MIPTAGYERYNPISREATDEYVASWSFGPWYGGREHALPRYIDDNTANLRIDLYEQMLLDAQVRASVNLLIYGIIGGGLEVYPASESSADRDVAKFIRDALLGEIEDTPLLIEVLPDMLSAMALGNKICEIIWNTPGESSLRIRENGPKAHTIKRIKVKAREEVAFYVDVYKNVTGIVGKVLPDRPLPPYTFSPMGYSYGFEAVFPLDFYKDNFGWISWKPINSLPTGSSDLRAAYDPWWFKQQAKPEYLKFLATSAIPSLIFELPPNAERRNKVKADGTTDDSAVTSPAQQVVDEAKKFQNTTVMAVANGTVPHVIQGAANEGRPFSIALDVFNAEIEKSITGQNAATSMGSAGRAPVVGQEIINLPTTYGRMVAEHFIMRFLVKPMMRRNYSRLVKAPIVVLPGLNKDDFLTSASGVSKLLLTNMMPPELWNRLFIETGLGTLEADTMQKLTDLFWKQKAMETQPPRNTSRLASDGQNIQEQK